MCPGQVVPVPPLGFFFADGVLEGGGEPGGEVRFEE